MPGGRQNILIHLDIAMTLSPTLARSYPLVFANTKLLNFELTGVVVAVLDSLSDCAM